MRHNTRLFIVLLLLYAAHLCLKYNSIAVPVFMSSYLADFLCLPFILSLFVMLVRYLKSQPTFQLPIAMIVFAVIYISFVFEFLIPRYSTRYTADAVDVVFYVIGAAFFFFFQKWERRKLGLRQTAPIL